jgi:hypothetical protein
MIWLHIVHFETLYDARVGVILFGRCWLMFGFPVMIPSALSLVAAKVPLREPNSSYFRPRECHADTLTSTPRISISTLYFPLGYRVGSRLTPPPSQQCWKCVAHYPFAAISIKSFF